MSKSLPDIVEFPKPELVEAEGATQVDPLKLLNGATCRVCYDDMLSTDLIMLRWWLGGDKYAPIEPQYGVDAGCVDFHVDPLYVSQRLDAYPEISYIVTRNGEDIPSQVQNRVRINLPTNFPKPTLMQAQDGVLDLSLLCCQDPVIWVEPWVFIDPIQTVKLYVYGKKKDGTRFRELFFEDEQVTEDEVQNGWSRTLPLAMLKELEHGSTLHLQFDVNFHVYRFFPYLEVTLLTEDHLDLIEPKVLEAVEVSPGKFSINPINTLNGATLRVSYEHMCPCDWVCPSWEGAPGAGSPALECKRADSREFVDFTVPPSAISANFNGQVTAGYTVRRDGETWPSPPLELDILGITGLPKPGLEEATGDVLDLNTFADSATAVVPKWDYAAVGQCCWMWITGTHEDGNPSRINVLMGEPLTAQWLSDGVDIQVARDELKQLKDCSEFELHFAVNFNDACELASAVEFPVKTFSIEQEAMDLPPPTVLQAVGSNLTVYNGKNGVTLRVKYPLINDRHQITVFWKRSDGTDLPLASKPGNSSLGYTDFAIPREAVIRGIGKTVTINYTVASLCKLQTSEDLELVISVPVRLPTPVITQATPPATDGGILDLATFSKDANVEVAPWWFILPGQTVWLRAIGTKAAGGDHVITVYLGKVVSAEEVSAGLADLLKRTELEQLRDGSELTVTCKVAADGSAHESAAVVFPSLTVELRRPLYDFTPFSAGWNAWYPGWAANGEMVLSYQLNRYCVKNGTASVAYIGPVLQKVYSGLRVGHRYEFSILACSYNGASPLPRLSLMAGSQQVAAITYFSQYWSTLQGSFTANATSMTLAVHSHEKDGQSGNDYAITNILVKG
ncbi:hypothetical protein PSH66_20715 [Pseudomonas sp. FP597]|uniref:hypothetical protein n=1 Tax=Pseudomonas sp. FP597 TaxID=2954096 RepID=UPI0027332B2F|nr:hypothetical protein [Pseudomonas sp. FP597]WLI05005.1 hypothetical protein PSH66_20715 [Pseudomonas sp. FP597]